MDYLNACPKRGRAYQRTLIHLLPFSTDLETQRVVDLCSKYEALITEAPVVCRRRGIQLMNEGKLVSSLFWLVKAGDVFTVESVCDKFMTQVFSDDKDEWDFPYVFGGVVCV